MYIYFYFELRINLKGIAIGNGVTDYFIQGPSFAEYAYTHSLISLAVKQRIDREWIQCLEEVCVCGLYSV